MWIANNWKEYEVLDCSSGEKLENWGGYSLIQLFLLNQRVPSSL